MSVFFERANWTVSSSQHILYWEQTNTSSEIAVVKRRKRKYFEQQITHSLSFVGKWNQNLCGMATTVSRSARFTELNGLRQSLSRLANSDHIVHTNTYSVHTKRFICECHLALPGSEMLMAYNKIPVETQKFFNKTIYTTTLKGYIRHYRKTQKP